VIFLISVVKKPLRTVSQEINPILREKTQDLMSSAPAPDDHDEFIQKGEQFIRKYVI